MDNILNKIVNSLAEVDYEATPKLCKNALEADISPNAILEALSKGMEIIGKRFENGEYFLSELIMAGEIFKEAQEIMGSKTQMNGNEMLGKIVIGTVQGDLHDLGKNIVVNLLRSEGFEVVDLGINVPAKKFVESIREHKPDVLGLSALLRATVPEMKIVVEELVKEGLRDRVKIVVGGLPLNDEYAKRIGADFYAKDAWLGVEIIKKLVDN
jgi:5-methyltetrahydrofolate--homocysteine methyltransferase